MFVLLGFLCLIIAVGLILAVVVQNSKGGGLSSAIVGGGATQLLGSRRSSELIEKITWYLFAGMVVFSIAATIVTSSSGTAASRLRSQEAIENQILTNPVLPPSNQSIEDAAQPATEPEN